MSNPVPLDPSLVRRLRRSLEGAVLAPDDPGYDRARRVWNGRIDRRPGAVARCASPADVRAAVDLAREEGLVVAVRGGGHDYAGNSVCDGGLVIDLSPMSSVEVDPDRRTARVGGGARWQAVDRAAQAHGLGTTGGTVSTVGVAGYTLGGGTGHLARRFGLGLDNLRSAEVVKADGELVTASEEENPDLFWALRGGGGNFGVVTSFEFGLREVGPEVLLGQTVHRLEAAPEVLGAFRDFMATAPKELQVYAFVVPLPPLEGLPRELHGEPVLQLVSIYSGAAARGEEILRPLRGVGDPVMDTLDRRQYVDVQTLFDPGVPEGQRWYSRGQYLAAIPDGAVEAVGEHCRNLPGAFTMVYFEPLGGAIARVDPEATAFPHRHAAYSFHVLAGWSEAERDREHMGWARSFHESMTPYAHGGVYVNLLSDDEADRTPEAYGVNHRRLRRLKARYDPDNLFRMNHNVEPAG